MTDKELRARAENIAITDYASWRDEEDAIFRELVAVKVATIKEVLRYEADVTAYESYCVGRGEKP